jgi:hypothetical protein
MAYVSNRYYASRMTKPPAPSDLADKFMLRMPDGMRDRVAAAARKNGRSMNAEIVARLEASFRPTPGIDLSKPFTAEVDTDAIADRIADRLLSLGKPKSGQSIKGMQFSHGRSQKK